MTVLSLVATAAALYLFWFLLIRKSLCPSCQQWQRGAYPCRICIIQIRAQERHLRHLGKIQRWR